MSINCSWEKPLGICYGKYDENLSTPIMIWGGGNCIAIFTTGKNKSLFNFIADEKHFKNCEYTKDDYQEITISYARKREAQKLIKLFASVGLEFTTTNEILNFKY